MERIKQLQARIDELTLRERAIILIASLLIITLAWYSNMMEPLLKEQKVLQASLESKQNQLRLVNEQFAVLTSRQGQDPDALNRKKLEELQVKVSAIKEEIQTTTANLVSPETMPEILRQVLNKTGGLRLNKLTGLGSKPLLSSTEEETANRVASNKETDQIDLVLAYKHGMQLEFSGDFHSTLQYIQELEAMEWKFFWEKIDYKVTDYPRATTAITVFTLSLDPNWIGI